jgi:hypothetical protein
VTWSFRFAPKMKTPKKCGLYIIFLLRCIEVKTNTHFLNEFSVTVRRWLSTIIWWSSTKITDLNTAQISDLQPGVRVPSVGGTWRCLRTYVKTSYGICKTGETFLDKH